MTYGPSTSNDPSDIEGPELDPTEHDPDEPEHLEPLVSETAAVGLDGDDGGGAVWPKGFEDDDALRSEFVRRWMMRPSSWLGQRATLGAPGVRTIPRTIIRFWHDLGAVPADVAACMDSWGRVRDEGVRFRFFDDATARQFIAKRYGPEELAAYAQCPHPAMRSDYLRLCVVNADGGLYVDADDVLHDDRWRDVFTTNTLKLQPLCYDIATDAMVNVEHSKPPDHGCGQATDRRTRDRIYYVNNNPLAAPAGHPVVRQALTRATRLLLAGDEALEVQSTTGPGNLTVVLAAHIHHLMVARTISDVELLTDWEATAEPSWVLDYRRDDRNWRLWDWRKRQEPGQQAGHRQHRRPEQMDVLRQPEQFGHLEQPVDGNDGRAGAE